MEADSPAWLMSIRRAGMRISELGFPTTEDEEWRFHKCAAIAEMTPQAAPANVRLTRRMLRDLITIGCAHDAWCL